MRFLSVTSLVACLLVVSANAAEPEASTAAPIQALVRINTSGELEVITHRPILKVEKKHRTVMVNETRQVPKPQTVKVSRGGKTVDETVVVNVEVVVAVPTTETYEDTVIGEEAFLERYPASMNGFYRSRDNAEFPFYNLSGERLSSTAVEERLGDWTLVLISKTGKALDRRFAELFQPTTIVIGMPPEKPQIPPAVGSSSPLPAAAPPAPMPKRPGRPASRPPADPVKEPWPQLPRSPQPTFAFAKAQGEKSITLRTVDEKTINLTSPVVRHERAAQEPAGEIRPPKRVQKVVETHETWIFSTSDVSASTAPNRELTTAELESILATEKLTAMSVDGQPVDPFWLRNLQVGSLVVVPPMDPMWRFPHHFFGAPRPVFSPVSRPDVP